MAFRSSPLRQGLSPVDMVVGEQPMRPPGSQGIIHGDQCYSILIPFSKGQEPEEPDIPFCNVSSTRGYPGRLAEHCASCWLGVLIVCVCTPPMSLLSNVHSGTEINGRCSRKDNANTTLSLSMGCHIFWLHGVVEPPQLTPIAKKRVNDMQVLTSDAKS